MSCASLALGFFAMIAPVNDCCWLNRFSLRILAALALRHPLGRGNRTGVIALDRGYGRGLGVPGRFRAFLAAWLSFWLGLLFFIRRFLAVVGTHQQRP